MAELLGTCFLVFFGCGAILNGTDITGVALSFGFAAYCMVYTVGSISGGHLNPAITTAFLVSGSLSVIEWGLYFISQMLGGIAGAGFLSVVYMNNYKGSRSIASVCNVIQDENMDDDQAFFLEYLMTMMLTFVVYAVVDPSNHTKENATSGPHAVGMAVAACHLIGLAVTGTSVNPARSFGPAVIALDDLVPGKTFDCWEHHWIFWIAPVCGSVTASLLYTYYFDEGEKVQGSAVAPLDVESMEPVIEEAIDSVVKDLLNGAQAEAEADANADETNRAVDEILDKSEGSNV